MADNKIKFHSVVFIIFSFCFLFSTFGFCALAATSDELSRSYLSGEYEEIIKEVNASTADEQSLYILGLTYLKTAEYAKARQAFGKLIERFPDSATRRKVMFKIADTYFLEGDYPKALGIYKEIERDQRNNDLTALLYLRFAQVAAKEGRWPDKDRYLSMIKNKYPGSPEEKYAEILEEHGDFFTIQVGAFSEMKNALQMKRELGKKFDPYTVQETKNGITIYKIRVGRFKTHSQAERTAEKLMEEGYPARIYP